MVLSRDIANRKGFSLVELLAVIGILAVLSVAAASGIGMVNAHRLTTAAVEVKATLELARQRAMAHGAPVDVWFYQTEPGTGDFEAYRVVFSGGAAGREGRLQRLPDGLAIRRSPEASPLLEMVPSVTDSQGRAARVVRFLGDGSLEGLRAAPPLALTIVQKNAPVVARDLPANFAALGLDPLLGTVVLYRP
jgi:uncharacterized protein (TIGR02596 family)